MGEWEGAPFIAMEFLEGQALDIRLTGKALTIDELLDPALQIADGLEAAHSQGFCHRDLRPNNLFITSRGQAKILDFGLPPMAGEGPIDGMDPTAHVPGTVLYLSPEKLRGEDIDGRSDLFSLAPCYMRWRREGGLSAAPTKPSSMRF
jgi:serine/threonine protein kinase